MIPESYALERVDVSVLSGFAGNPRTHSDGQVKQIAASIAEFGWTNPILVDATGTIIAGHGRLAAAKELG
ncbi:ParB/Srx family N-terminal domain-containing protein [Aestuariivirga sp.]|uniref:ParB/Srx family N-terminal domain-containing protein n=1 Tax=Aestuariivirga sp. TaxID=2650926 RepID=UPI0035942A5A